jgi:transaldolase
MHAIRKLHELGQSAWYDYIERNLVVSGELKRLIEEDGLAGMTSNPTIFDNAIRSGHDYDASIRAAASRGESDVEILEGLTTDDIRGACDVFRPLYDASGTTDGLVSIEVSPRLAHDTKGSIAEAKRLWQRVDRPNLMVKIPGTREGLPAIYECLSAGININITLLFSVERYSEVILAYIAALEDRDKRGERLDRISSVASFFVSRVDTKVDKALSAIVERAPSEALRDEARALQGKIAICNAKVAYDRFRRAFQGPRWERLAAQGARPQRVLWGSTSTKNPRLPDVYYVEALIGPHTVDTMPPKTFRAYIDHGRPEVRLDRDLATCQGELARLETLGLSLPRMTQELEDEGVASFSASFDAALGSVAEKRRALER